MFILIPIFLNPFIFFLHQCQEKPCPFRTSATTHSDETDDVYYHPFEKVYGQKITEEHQPTLKAKCHSSSIGFYASQQHDLWHLLFCSHKLTVQERSLLQITLEDISYSCGATLEELNLPGRLEGVCVKAHTCNDPMEKLYYSCGYEPVCYYCCALVEFLSAM